jgi:hypothetical protein
MATFVEFMSSLRVMSNRSPCVILADYPTPASSTAYHEPSRLTTRQISYMIFVFTTTIHTRQSRTSLRTSSSVLSTSQLSLISTIVTKTLPLRLRPMTLLPRD